MSAMMMMGRNVAGPVMPEDTELKPGEVSTGTTTIAVAFDGGVVLGADSRTSMGIYVSSRSSDKIAQLSDYVFCCRSGSAADTQHLCEYVKYYLASMTIETGRQPQVKTVAHLLRTLAYRNKSNISGSFLVAGWDPVKGGQIYQITQGGSVFADLPYTMGGSGSIFSAALMDAEYQPNMTAEKARTMVKKILSHSMSRDPSSGGNMRTVLVTADGADKDFTPGNRLPVGPSDPQFN